MTAHKSPDSFGPYAFTLAAAEAAVTRLSLPDRAQRLFGEDLALFL